MVSEYIDPHNIRDSSFNGKKRLLIWNGCRVTIID